MHRRILGMLGLVAVLVTVLIVGVHGAPAGAPASPTSIKVGLVTDEATLADRALNWFSYQGLLRAECELGVVGTAYTSTSSAEYAPNLEQCVSDGNVLCISVGFGTADAISTTALANPGTLFAIVDIELQRAPTNLRSLTFAADEAGYLAGALAGSDSSGPAGHGTTSSFPMNATP